MFEFLEDTLLSVLTFDWDLLFFPRYKQTETMATIAINTAKDTLALIMGRMFQCLSLLSLVLSEFCELGTEQAVEL